MPGGTTSLHPPGHYDQHKACWSSKYYTKRTETIVLTDTTFINILERLQFYCLLFWPFLYGSENLICEEVSVKSQDG